MVNLANKVALIYRKIGNTFDYSRIIGECGPERARTPLIREEPFLPNGLNRTGSIRSDIAPRPPGPHIRAMTGHDITVYDPRKLARDERRVNRGFWRKLRRVLGRIPFGEDLLAAYYCATDGETPSWVKAVLMGAVAYFVLPTHRHGLHSPTGHSLLWKPKIHGQARVAA